MRPAGSRRCGVSRAYSTNPVTLPMRSLLLQERALRLHHRMSRFGLGGLIPRDSEHAFEFVREYFDELGQHLAPVLKDPFAARAAGGLDVPLDQMLERLHVGRIDDRFQVDTRPNTMDARELAGFI